ncbi:hypothetical protein RND71_019786 [Anisodus tanguticus]|uniref:Cytochrome P450 n=1 Tax=Anisodus tanguticus TaxID=243964 RepID=A0AAE1VGU1_9SOLA|nr:hypothetical protein RND71_019786 [Anisodus tanguticus]
MIIEEHKQKLKLQQVSKKKDGEEDSIRKDDLVNLLLRLQESGTLEFPFSADNIKAVIMDMFLAGTETSATDLDFGRW